MNRKEFVKISKIAFKKWQSNNASIRAAALAFFTIMPLPSLLLVLLELFTLLYGREQALSQLTMQITNIAGPTVADIVNELIGSESNALMFSFGSVVTVIFAIIGAVGAFVVLQDSLNAIWGITPHKHKGLKMKIRERIVPFLTISFAGIIVVAWTGGTNILFISVGYLLGSQASLVLGGAQVFLSFVLTAILFGLIYKQLPDAKINWKDVILAAVIASLVSTGLDYLFGVYIRAFPATSLSGTAGAVIVLMLWIFVTDEFILFGAQFSKTYSEIVGSRRKMQTRIKTLSPSVEGQAAEGSSPSKDASQNLSDSRTS